MSIVHKKQGLWKDNETSIPFVSPELSISKEKRFKIYSIYWPEKSVSTQSFKKKRSEIDEEAHRISKLIDEQEKNEMRMNKGKSSLKKIMNKTSNGFQQTKDGFSTFRSTQVTKLSKQNQQILDRLATVSKNKQAKLRDRHGFRTNLYENQEDEIFERLKEKGTFVSPEKGFYTSRRVNLNLPHNYYPGPGTYQIKRYLESQKIRPQSHRQI